MPRTFDDTQAAAAGANVVAVGENVRRRERRAVASNVLPERRTAFDQLFGDAVSSEETASEVTLESGILVIARPPCRGPRRRGDSSTGALRDDCGETGVVEMVVREQNELDLVEPDAKRIESGLECLERLRVRGSRVDEGEGIPDEDQTFTVPRYGTGIASCSTPGGSPAAGRLTSLIDTP